MTHSSTELVACYWIVVVVVGLPAPVQPWTIVVVVAAAAVADVVQPYFPKGL